MPNFKFVVGQWYTTQTGDLVQVLGRTTEYKGYETLICSDGRHRYDRSTFSCDAGRCTGTSGAYTYPHNFRKEYNNELVIYEERG